MWAVCRFYFYVNDPFCRYRTIARLSGSFVLGRTFERERAKGLVCVQGEDPIGARDVKTFEVCAKQRPTSRAEFMETREASGLSRRKYKRRLARLWRKVETFAFCFVRDFLFTMMKET